MKGSGEDLPSGLQSKRRQLGPVALDMTHEDVVAFLKVVDETFRDEKENRQMFADAMNDFNEKRIGQSVFIARVQEIIKEHQHLVDGFDAIIPVGHQLYLKGFVFYEKVEERIGTKDEFQTFKDILYAVGRDNQMTKEEFKSDMSFIIGGHPDLMVGFRELLQTGYIKGFSKWLYENCLATDSA